MPSKENVDTDEESRWENFDTECKLNPEIHSHVLHFLDHTPEIDLFASWLNAQFKRYIPYRPDPHTVAVDAFVLNWGQEKFNVFPPFCIIVLQKICKDKAKGIIVIPDWANQPWYAAAAKMLVNTPVLLSARHNQLTLQEKNGAIALATQNSRLIICKVSGVNSDAQKFCCKLH